MEIVDFRRPISIAVSGKGDLAIICDHGDWFRLIGLSIKEEKEDKTIKETSLPSINSITFSKSDSLYALDPHSNQIIKFGTHLDIRERWELPDGTYGSISRGKRDDSLLISRMDSQQILCIDLPSNTTVEHYCYKDLGTSVRCKNFFESERHLYLLDTENAHCYQIENKKPSKPKRFLSFGRGGAGKCRSPSGVLVSGTQIYVNDLHNYLLQVFDENLSFINEFGGKGENIGQFDLPVMSAAWEGKIYVCDKNNDRIVCIGEDDSESVDVITCRHHQGQLRRPSCLAIDSEKRIFVADRSNGLIQVFDENLKFCGLLGAGRLSLHRPSSIAIHTDEKETRYYLAERREGYDCRIKIYESHQGFEKLRLRKEFESGVFNDPQDIAVSEDGVLFVADTLNRRLFRYDFRSSSSNEIDMVEITGNDRILIKSVCASNNGRIYTADFDLGIVYEFSNQLKFLRSIDLSSSLKQGLEVLRAVFVDRELLFICGRGEKQIKVYDLEGVFLSDIAPNDAYGKHWNHPVKIAKFGPGEYLVADKENDRVTKFTFKTRSNW